MAGVSDSLGSLGRRQLRNREGLGDPQPGAPLPAERGTGRPAASAEADGGGIDSPLSEDKTKREYWPDSSISSSDGLFVIVYRPYKKRVFVDAAGRLVEFQYPAPAP